MDIEGRVERWTVLHPFLFGLFPILFFFSQNIGQLSYWDMLVSSLPALGLSILALLIGLAMYGSWRKAAIIASLVVFLFFSYSHVYSVIRKTEVLGFLIGRHRFLLPVWVFLFSSGMYILFQAESELRSVTGFLNIASATVVGMSLLSIGFHESTTQRHETELLEGIDIEQTPRPTVDSLPDIYYIVLDGYPISQTLYNIYDFDNSKFELYLENKGFYVAGQSLSNYTRSKYSIPSSLNLSYLNHKSLRNKNTSNITKNSRILKYLNKNGYKTYNLSSGTGATHSNEFADKNLYCGPWWDKDLYRNLVKITILGPIASHFGLFRSGWNSRINCTFKKIANIPTVGEPSFVFSHIITPHPPYVLGKNEKINIENNTLLGSWDKEDYFLEEIKNTNALVKNTLEELDTENSVILIQGDHGTRSTNEISSKYYKERVGILNAYHLPGNCGSNLYPSISPVNSFRVVLNCYFDTDLKILPDRSYSDALREITDRARWNSSE
ncbi:hypothetical protein [Salinibacter ruber]|uniref:hypothetical protein n=1 Tax=Salinibacter ruber TaxID=146919 RepID=UPI00161E8CB8|nr:hypothetical protein [Salinibacter ruber]MBB4059632.1 hypothetical protein [Salinibacter ruber]